MAKLGQFTIILFLVIIIVMKLISYNVSYIDMVFLPVLMATVTMGIYQIIE